MSGRPVFLQDAESFCKLYEKNHLVVFRFIYGLQGGPAEEVEDLTAETFMRAWQARRRFEGDEEAALGWLLRIARNLIIDAYRRRKTRGTDQNIEDFQLPANESGPEEQADKREQLRLLWIRIGKLQDEQREIVVLRYLLDWPVYRIAAHLGMLENTVSVTLRRTLIRLRDSWPEEE